MRIRLRAASRVLPLLLGAALLAGCAPAADHGGTPSATAAPSAADCSVQRCVALTFDDGPGPYTEQLLDQLQRAQVPATFFLIGKKVADYPQLVRRMAQEGHELGNHTWNHADLTKLTGEQLDSEVRRTDQAIAAASGQQPTVLRPPFGRHTAQQDRLIPHPVVLWDVNTLDGSHRDPKTSVARALQGAQPGSIILMHDVREHAVQAVPEMIAQLQARGYHLVTVQQLFDGSELAPGHAYSSGPRPAAG